jgi:hypothetical protein
MHSAMNVDRHALDATTGTPTICIRRTLHSTGDGVKWVTPNGGRVQCSTQTTLGPVTFPTLTLIGPFKAGLIWPLIWLLIAISQPRQSNTNK